MISELALGLMLVTGYNLTGTTASGTQTHVGTAACPPDLPFGTKVRLEGKGMVLDVVCEDRFADYLSPRFDVWVAHTREAYAMTGYWQATVLVETLCD